MSNDRRIVVIDCQVAGVSGDMIVGTLLDLGADSAKVVRAMKSVKNHIEGCEDIEVTVRDVTRKEFRAKKVDVKAKEINEMSGLELIKATARCLEHLELSKEAKRFALNSIKTLVDTEARIHGESIREVHLHEAGTVDTPADIIGTAVAADDLGIFNMKVYSTPVAVGGGLFKFSHGTVSSPAPATVEILRSKEFPMTGGPITHELATPTGVSLLVNLTSEVVRFYPPMKTIAIGYGAGTKDFTEMPNVMRIILGESLDCSFLKDEIWVLETNLDDVTGEIIGHTIDKLMQEGAKDVSIIPVFTKKNRAGQIIKVLADKADVERLVQVLVKETGTLGVRLYSCKRRILGRELVPIRISIDDVEATVNVKIARDRGGSIIQIKPEYEEIRRLAEKTSKPLRELMKLVEMKAITLLQR